MKNIKIKTTGLSLLELREKYGTSGKGFWSYNTWWLNETFAKEKPPAGEYEFYTQYNFKNMTYDEQVKAKPEGFDFSHPAVLADMILVHHKKTGEWLLNDWWSRTNVRSSSGYLVLVGRCDSDGVRVVYLVPDSSYSNLGVRFSRSVKSSVAKPVQGEAVPCNLESRVKSLESDMEKIKKFLII